MTRSVPSCGTTNRTTELPLELIDWPRQARLRRTLAKAGVPRVLLIEPGTERPKSVGIDEGAVRSDASDQEIDACARRVLDQLRSTNQISSIDSRSWSVEGYTFRLTSLQARLFTEFVAHRGHIVTYERLCTAGWAGDHPTLDAVQSAVQRLREQLIGTGLRIGAARGIGFLLA